MRPKTASALNLDHMPHRAHNDHPAQRCLDAAALSIHVSAMITRTAFYYFGYFTYGPPARGVLLRAR